MKRFFLCLCFLILAFTASAQYLRIAVEGRIWYSRGGFNSFFTDVLAVEGDTLIGTEIYPLLVEKDSTLTTIDTIAYLDEDTLAGTLKIDYFDPYQYNQYYDFSMNEGDTVHYNMYYTNNPGSVIIDSAYYITDFRGVSRKVMTFKDFGQSCWIASYYWIEGLGSANILTTPLPECGLSHVPGYELHCVFDDSLKIYGDTVQKCYFEKISLEETYLRKAEIFPNPVQGDFIEVSSELPVEHLEIMDNMGKLVVKLENPESLIDISTLPPGTYLLRYQNVEGEHFIGKMIRK